MLLLGCLNLNFGLWFLYGRGLRLRLRLRLRTKLWVRLTMLPPVLIE